MKKNRSLKGFTLIELLVVIAIAGILFVGASGLNFNATSDKQKLLLFNNKIISQFETIRNNTLLGKGVDANIGVPDSWKIKYSTTGSGQIDVFYNTGSWVSYPSAQITTQDFYEINNISCETLAGGGAGSGTGEVIIQGNNLTLSGSCNPSARILKFDTKYRAFTGSFTINTLNGLIEKN